MQTLRALLIAVAFVVMAGCSGTTGTSSTTTGIPSTTSHAATTSATSTIVKIETNIGNMTAQLYDSKAPITVANFKTYVQEGFYTNRQFYRIEPGFVTQGGGERQGNTGSHPAIQNEAKTSGLSNTKYTVAMARTNAPNSATTEFYINAADNLFLDAGGSSPDGYAVFGIIQSGRDVADRLNTMKGVTPVPAILSISIVI